MGKYASGKFAKRISDRSGMAFPYNEMVQEWTGVWVHISEYEPKQPQLEPLPIVTDPQSLQYPRAQIANARVFVGGALGPINAGRTVARPATGDDAPYDSTGFGLQVKSAIERGVENIILTLGGSATIDGGCGAMIALGVKFYDDKENIIKDKK